MLNYLIYINYLKVVILKGQLSWPFLCSTLTLFLPLMSIIRYKDI